jgi:hypothetical protein
MKNPNVKCLSCRVDFYKKPCNILKSPNHFCSNKCRGLYFNKQIEVQCLNCKLFFLKELNKIKKYPNHFCSIKCCGIHKNKKTEVVCFNCKKLFMKEQCEIKRAPRHCCSKDCFKMMAKYKKNWGSNRSKLEIYIEKKLTEDLELNILYNKTSIGYELDIHIPELNLAIELNGITHYKPIYGLDALLKRQEIDRLKAAECIKQNISLIVINVSNDKSNKSTLEKRYNNIKALILNRIKLYKYFSNQPIAIEI